MRLVAMQWSFSIRILCLMECMEQWSNGLLIKALDSQSMGPVFKTTG